MQTLLPKTPPGHVALVAPLARDDDVLPAPYCAPMNMSPRWRSIGPEPPLDDGPGAVVKFSSLLVASALNSTDIFLIPVGTNCYLPNSGWALAVK